MDEKRLIEKINKLGDHAPIFANMDILCTAAELKAAVGEAKGAREWVATADRLPVKPDWYEVTIYDKWNDENVVKEAFFTLQSDWTGSELDDTDKVVAWRNVPQPFTGGAN